MQVITLEILMSTYAFTLTQIIVIFYVFAAVGKTGVDKRIDVLSMAMMSELTIDELTEFEVAYAPPYSHPKDLVNMIGYKARDL